MRAAIENWLLQTWYDSKRPPWYLRMLEPMYRLAFQHHQNKALAGSAYRPETPLIVVGNITVGGSGKTPLVIRLCEIALEMNLKPGIASTGYGRQSKETLVARADSDTRLCGDEPVLLALRTNVPVMVAANRLDAVRKLDQMNLDILFSDDGMQQANLARDVEFCVVDGERGLGNGHLIPAGPLREASDRLTRVDHVVSNGRWAGRPGKVDVHVMNLHTSMVCSLDRTKSYSFDQFRQIQAGIRFHAVAGIGNPGRFFRTLEALNLDLDTRAFPDHHLFTRKDFDSLPADSAIIMTEKDAVKCRVLGLHNAWYVAVDAHLPTDFEHRIKDRIAKLIQEQDQHG
jgi:tetraacyldisaccharide 4'-kinase